MATPTPPVAPKPSFLRAFLPFWITLVLGSAVLLRDYHVRQAALARIVVRVTVQGMPPDEGFDTEVNGRPHDLAGPPSLGFGKILISAPGTESQAFDRLIWYGLTDLGTVDLLRSRGSLTAHVVPPPDSYELTGKRGGWTNVTGEFSDVPVGRYELVSRFGALSEKAMVEVSRNQTERVDFRARIGALELSAEPAEGEFELVGIDSGERQEGKFPSTFARLPSGEYRLIAKRPGYVRELKLDVRPNETNRFVAKFVYGAASITTAPAGANLSWSGVEMGKAPITLTKVVPGMYRLEASLEGYDTSSIDVKVDGELTAAVGLDLVNTRYRKSMMGARQSLEKEQFGSALAYLEDALAAQPRDVAASEILPGTRAKALRIRADELAGRGEFDAALKAIDAALVDVPGDAAMLALQEKVRWAKTQTPLQLAEARFRQLVAEAMSAAGQQDFEKALALFDAAKEASPEKPEVAEPESAFRKEQQKWVAELAKRRREEGIATRSRKFKEAWDRVLNDEKDERSFAEHSWKTGKSLSDVRVALIRVGAGDAIFKVAGLNAVSQEILLVKSGEIAKGFNGGYYVQVGVFQYEEGNTQIRTKLIEYAGGRPETNADTLRKHVERFRAALAVQLGNDLY
jgi:tetratricopeptide (TPR) repeat protein